MFGLSTNKCYNEWFKSIQQMFNVLSPINQKGMQDYKTFSKWQTFVWSAKTLLKTSNNVLIFHMHILYLFPNLWNVIL